MVNLLIPFIVFLIFGLVGLGLSLVGSAGGFLILLGAVLYDAIVMEFVIPSMTLNLLLALAVLAELFGFVLKRVSAKKREQLSLLFIRKAEESALLLLHAVRLIIVLPLLWLFGSKKERRKICSSVRQVLVGIKRSWVALPRELWGTMKNSLKLYALAIIIKGLLAVTQLFMVLRIILADL